MAQGGALTRGLVAGGISGVIVGGVLIGGAALILDGADTPPPERILSTAQSVPAFPEPADRAQPLARPAVPVPATPQDVALATPAAPTETPEVNSEVPPDPSGEDNPVPAAREPEIDTAMLSPEQALPEDEITGAAPENAGAGAATVPEAGLVEDDPQSDVSAAETAAGTPAVAAPAVPVLEISNLDRPATASVSVKTSGKAVPDRGAQHAAPSFLAAADADRVAGPRPIAASFAKTPAVPELPSMGGRPPLSSGSVSPASDVAVASAAPALVEAALRSDDPPRPDAAFRRVSLPVAAAIDPRPKLAFLLDARRTRPGASPFWAESVLVDLEGPELVDLGQDYVAVAPDLLSDAAARDFGRRASEQDGPQAFFVDGNQDDAALLDIVRTTGHALVFAEGSGGAWVSAARQATPASAVVYTRLNGPPEETENQLDRALRRAERDGGAIVLVPDEAEMRATVGAWLATQSEEAGFAVVPVSNFLSPETGNAAR